MGSNKFQGLLEKTLAEAYPPPGSENLQDVVTLLKGLTEYHFKTTELKSNIWSSLRARSEELSTKQLETTIWAISKRPQVDISENHETI
jgi:hypothetical protein